ncbi:MAG: DNA-binding transcriptional LysR family regulator [Paracoccaceae bacterium]|jgi:DNA-binding transcriptional LysR family regulator
MDPRFLTQLALIVELGSITKAAFKLNITQPTLSRSVKIIEDRVGGAVLRRGRYGVTPTDIGLRLAEEGKEILLRSKNAQKAVQDWKNGLTGEIRVGVGPMLAATIMGDFFAETILKPPTYGLKIYCEYAARLVDRLNNDQLDIAIIPSELDRNEDKLFKETLFQDRLSVFVNRDDPLTKKSSVLAKELSQYQWISVGEETSLFDNTSETLDLLGLSGVSPIIENTGDVNMTFRMLERAKACSILPVKQIHFAKERFHIAPVNLDLDLATRNIALWTRELGRDRPEIIDFVNKLNTYLFKIDLNPR